MIDHQDSISNSKELWEIKANQWIKDNRDAKLSCRRDTMICFLNRHKTSGSVLDIGCGDGLLCLELAKRGFDVYGCDVSEALVSASRAALAAVMPDAEDRIRLIQDNRIPFEMTFDLITILGVLVYIPNHAAYLKDVSARLRPGGMLVASSTQRFSVRTLYDVLRNLARPRPVRSEWWRGLMNLPNTGIWSGGYLPGRGSGRTFSVRGLERVLRRTGFEPVDRLYVYDFESLDRRPLERSKTGTALARTLGWRQTVAARLAGGAALAPRESAPHA